MNMLANTPTIRTPLTDFAAIFGVYTSQNFSHPQCKRFELKYLDCMEAYGLEKGSVKCKYLFEDYYECERGEKQDWRYEQMRAERLKQIKSGKLKQKYMEPPEPEIFYSVNL